MIRGTTVTLYERVQTGVDGFKRPIYQDVPDEVENVLVSPATMGTGAQILSVLQLDGKHPVYELAIPKEDRHNWEDRRVDIFGRPYRVCGTVAEYIEENVPGPWHRRCWVEAYE